MDDAAAAAVPSTAQLKTVAALASAMAVTAHELRESEARTAELGQRMRQLTDVDMPNALHDVGMRDFTLSDGTKILMKDVVAASITKANMAEAFKWLRANKHGGLIKTKVEVLFGRDEQAKAARVVAQLKTKGYDYSLSESVHPQTLAAWVRELIKEKTPFPKELFGVYEAERAIVVPPPDQE